MAPGGQSWRKRWVGQRLGSPGGDQRTWGRVVNVFGGKSRGAGALQGRLEGLGGGQDLLATGRVGTHGSPPSKALPREACEDQGGQSMVRTPRNPLPSAGLPSPHLADPPTFQPHQWD